jgi:pimeloyl-ACP methyl ester carboxylesterase
MNIIKKNWCTWMSFALVSCCFISCAKEENLKNHHEHFFLLNRGQSMPITVAGNLASNKIILIVHGGPGGTSLVYRSKYVREYVESNYAVAYWDQRYAGNTQGNAGSISLESYKEDVKKLLQLLRHKYGLEKKIYLMGHSWGGYLVPYFLIDGHNQDLADGWIQVGGAHDLRLLGRLTHEMLLHYGRIELEAGRNKAAWQEIVDWCEMNGYSSRSQFSTLNGFAHRAESLIADVIEPESPLGELFFHNNFSFNSYYTNLIMSALFNVIGAAKDENISNFLHRIQTPTLLLWGKYDFVCPTGLAFDIQDKMSIQDVEYVEFARSGHSPMSNQPILFWETVIDWIDKR